MTGKYTSQRVKSVDENCMKTLTFELHRNRHERP